MEEWDQCMSSGKTQKVYTIAAPDYYVMAARHGESLLAQKRGKGAIVLFAADSGYATISH